jgi:hypothetical protein
VASSGFIKEGCSCAPHRWRQSKDRSIRIQNLTKVVVSWKHLGLAEQRWYYLKLAGTRTRTSSMYVSSHELT